MQAESLAGPFDVDVEREVFRVLDVPGGLTLGDTLIAGDGEGQGAARTAETHLPALVGALPALHQTASIGSMWKGPLRSLVGEVGLCLAAVPRALLEGEKASGPTPGAKPPRTRTRPWT
jgi:hypothetical protein